MCVMLLNAFFAFNQHVWRTHDAVTPVAVVFSTTARAKLTTLEIDVAAIEAAV